MQVAGRQSISKSFLSVGQGAFIVRKSVNLLVRLGASEKTRGN